MKKPTTRKKQMTIVKRLAKVALTVAVSIVAVPTTLIGAAVGYGMFTAATGQAPIATSQPTPRADNSDVLLDVVDTKVDPDPSFSHTDVKPVYSKPVTHVVKAPVNHVVHLKTVKTTASTTTALVSKTSGKCYYPTDVDSRGRRCGNRAASVRKGGRLGGYK
jgi:hypothetical protein